MSQLSSEKRIVKRGLSFTLAVLGVAISLGSLYSLSDRAMPKASGGITDPARSIEQRAHEVSADISPSTLNPPPGKPDRMAQARLIETYGRLPLRFEANQGQADPRVRFLSRGSGYNLFLAPTEAVLSLGKTVRPPAGEDSNHRRRGSESHDAGLKCASLRMKILGGNPDPTVRGRDELPGKSNYFVGNDPGRWRANVRSYTKVEYADVYPGVDLIYYGNQQQLEYDLVVRPGGDPAAIKFAFEGGESLTTDEAGDLIIRVGDREIRQKKPLVYQARADGRQPVAGKYVVTSGNIVTFDIAQYNRRENLVIDPVIVYSTFLGSSGGNGNAFHVRVDAAGNAYVVGYTASPTFPTTAGAFDQAFSGQLDTFVLKLNPSGSDLVYATYLGGNSVTTASDLAVDSAGNACVVGVTSSPDFPVTAGAFQQTFLGTNGPGARGVAFVTKLGADGTTLLFSSFLSGSIDYFDNPAASVGRAVAVDKSGCVYVAGTTEAVDFPVTPGSFQTTLPRANQSSSGEAAFVSKFDPTGSSLIYSTFLGGKRGAGVDSLAIDRDGNAYVAGLTQHVSSDPPSASFPTTPGAFGTGHSGDPDGNYAYIAKVNPAGTGLVYSTFLGGIDSTGIARIVVDESGNTYIGGSTSSPDFPTTPGTYSVVYGGGRSDAFVAELNSQGSQLIYSTLIGGNDTDGVSDLAVESSGAVYLVGGTYSGNFPTTPDAVMPAYLGNGDAFFVKLASGGSSLIYSTYLGGSNGNSYDTAYGVAVDPAGDAYVLGKTSSISDFPVTPGAFNTTFPNPYAQAFYLMKLKVGRAASQVTMTSTTNPSLYGQQITLNSIVTPLSPGVGTPGGSVKFFDGSTLIGAAPLDAGSASLSLGTLPPGIHSITVAYGGDTAFLPATSSAYGLTVNPAADLSITENSSANSVTLGDSVTYVFTVSNGGPSQATGVKMVDSLFTQMTIVSVAATTGACDKSQYTIICTFGDMAAGATVAVTVVAKPLLVQTSTPVNNVTVSAVEADPDGSNNSASQDLTVAAPPSVNGAAGDMITGRDFHTATLLQNGKVLIAAGQGAGGAGILSSAELYDPATGRWSATGNLNQARFAHTSTMLPNGKVLVAGGQGSTPPTLDSAELYDPATGIWAVTGSLGDSRIFATATLLTDGKVLVAGGYNTSQGDLATAELYDPSTGAWSATGKLNFPRESASATLLPDGRVLVTGGNLSIGGENRLTSCELYDPTSGTWSVTGSFSVLRGQHSSVLLPNGKVLLVGGSSAATTELYDPASGGWTATGDLNEPRLYWHTANLLPSGQVFIAGGLSAIGRATESAELYNPDTGAWTVSGSLKSARYLHTATLLSNGELLIAGGQGNGAILKGAELYDAAAGKWSITAPLSQIRLDHAATLLADGRVLVVGGDNASGFLSGAELFDPSSETWHTTGSLNTARNGTPATLLPNGKVLVAGGFGSSAPLSSAELYDPASGTWSFTGSLNVPRFVPTATLLPNGKVLVVGGYNNGSGTLKSAELYDPVSGTWSQTGSLNVARRLHTATLLPDGKVLVAGGFNIDVTASAELYDPDSGTWQLTTSLSQPRYVHTATLLPNGKVLVAAGDGGNGNILSSAELYDPTHANWSPTGNLGTARWGHTAALLPNGRVLVAGGGSSRSIADAELYEPSTGNWMTTASLNTERFAHTMTLLVDNRVLVTGGGSNNGGVSSAELFDTGLNYQEAWRPVLSTANSPMLLLGSPQAITGARFRGISEASGGVSNQDSATNYPLIRLQSLVNEEVRFLNPDGVAGWSDTEFTSLPLNDFPQGYALLTVFTNGIPSRAIVVLVRSCSPLMITTQPSDQTAVIGENAVFNSTASGTPGASVQWQQSLDGGISYRDISGATESSLSVQAVSVAQSGTKYRAVFTSSCDTVATSAATLAVSKAALTVTANDASKLLGAPNPTFTARYDGFVLGQNAGVLGGTLTFTTTAAQGSPVGSYPITPGGLTSNNYAITYRAGTLKVGYNVCVLYDQTKSSKSGSTIPVKLQLCDASGADRSSASVTVQATGVIRASNQAPEALHDSGNANPDFNFRFDATLGPTGGYIFNLSTKGYPTGTFLLSFVVTGDPTPHAVQFSVR